MKRADAPGNRTSFGGEDPTEFFAKKSATFGTCGYLTRIISICALVGFPVDSVQWGVTVCHNSVRHQLKGLRHHAFPRTALTRPDQPQLGPSTCHPGRSRANTAARPQWPPAATWPWHPGRMAPTPRAIPSGRATPARRWRATPAAWRQRWRRRADSRGGAGSARRRSGPSRHPTRGTRATLGEGWGSPLCVRPPKARLTQMAPGVGALAGGVRVVPMGFPFRQFAIFHARRAALFLLLSLLSFLFLSFSSYY